MHKYHAAVKTSVFFFLPVCILLIASCNNNADNECAKNEQQLQEQIRTKDQRISDLEDSVRNLSKGMLVTDTTSSENAGAAFNAMEASLYKKGKTRSTQASAEMHKKYPGEFPEGSARLLSDKDLKFLSEWGLKVMLNEIYARHGMTFTDDALQKHFNHANWYHGTSANIDNKLSKTEKTNIRLIKDYKFTPVIPT